MSFYGDQQRRRRRRPEYTYEQDERTNGKMKWERWIGKMDREGESLKLEKLMNPIFSHCVLPASGQLWLLAVAVDPVARPSMLASGRLGLNTSSDV